MSGATKYNCLTCCEDSHLIEKTLRLLGNNPPEMIDIIWVLETV